MNDRDNFQHSVSRHLDTLKKDALFLSFKIQKSRQQCQHEFLLEYEAQRAPFAKRLKPQTYSPSALIGRVFDSCDSLASSIAYESSYILIGMLMSIAYDLSAAASALGATTRMSRVVKKGLKQTVKQQEKKIVKECWIEWQKNPSQYKSNSAFANAMLKKFEPDDPADQDKHLSNAKVITVWCTDWKKEVNHNSK